MDPGLKELVVSVVSAILSFFIGHKVGRRKSDRQ